MFPPHPSLPLPLSTALLSVRLVALSLFSSTPFPSFSSSASSLLSVSSHFPPSSPFLDYVHRTQHPSLLLGLSLIYSLASQHLWLSVFYLLMPFITSPWLSLLCIGPMYLPLHFCLRALSSLSDSSHASLPLSPLRLQVPGSWGFFNTRLLEYFVPKV